MTYELWIKTNKSDVKEFLFKRSDDRNVIINRIRLLESIGFSRKEMLIKIHFDFK